EPPTVGLEGHCSVPCATGACGAAPGAAGRPEVRSRHRQYTVARGAASTNERRRPLGRRRQDLERVRGIEPPSPAWKAGALPLSYTRTPPDTLRARRPYGARGAKVEYSTALRGLQEGLGRVWPPGLQSGRWRPIWYHRGSLHPPGAGRGRPRQTVGANQGGDDGMERLRQGLVLVIVGIVLYFLVREQGSGSGGVILALIGSAFMVFYALTNQSGYLVPGGLMTGLGIGIDWPHAWWPGFQGST